MSRVQLALNVNDIDEAVSFYAKLFGAEPAKRKPGYANFAITAGQVTQCCGGPHAADQQSGSSGVCCV